jgi:hypothetical protein
MMKSRQTVAQQSHRRGMAFGATAALFWKSRPERRLIRRASCAVVCLLHAAVVIPMAAKNFSGFMFPDAAYSLAPSSPSPAINSPCEEGCCSRDYEQDATRHAALRCLLRVTADDIRQRYSAPVSGILAPQRVSNLRIVTKR